MGETIYIQRTSVYMPPVCTRSCLLPLGNSTSQLRADMLGATVQRWKFLLVDMLVQIKPPLASHLPGKKRRRVRGCCCSLLVTG